MTTFSRDGKSGAGHPGLDAETTDALLEKLSADDAFRGIFQQNPAKALAQLGVGDGKLARTDAPQRGEAFYCMTSERLASKEEIAAARAKLREHLMQAGNHTVVFCFEADRIDSALDRS